MSEIQSNPSTFGKPSASNVSVPEEPATRFNMDMFDFGQHPLLLGLGQSASDKKSPQKPMAICRVCGSQIPLEGYHFDEHFIVKCSQCKEATPIRPAPPGERYVRCVCNCLLICRQSANKVACPRLNCQRIITVLKDTGNSKTALQVTSTATQPPPGTCRLTCVHCRQPFIFNILQKSLTRCPCCGKISAFIDDHYRDEMRKSILLSLIFFVMTVVIIFVNSVLSPRFTGETALYVVLFAITILVSIRPIVALRLKASTIDGQI